MTTTAGALRAMLADLRKECDLGLTVRQLTGAVIATAERHIAEVEAREADCAADDIADAAVGYATGYVLGGRAVATQLAAWCVEMVSRGGCACDVSQHAKNCKTCEDAPPCPRRCECVCHCPELASLLECAAEARRLAGEPLPQVVRARYVATSDRMRQMVGEPVPPEGILLKDDRG